MSLTRKQLRAAAHEARVEAAERRLRKTFRQEVARRCRRCRKGLTCTKQHAGIALGIALGIDREQDGVAREALERLTNRLQEMTDGPTD